MNKYLSGLIVFFILSGCAAIREYFQTGKTFAYYYTIEPLGLTMGVPFAFNVIIAPKIKSEDLSKGLIWMIEKDGQAMNHLTKIELLYDRNDEAIFSMDRYIKDTALPDLIGNGKNMKTIRSKLRISGIPAQLIEVVNQYKGTQGEYQLHIKEAILKKDQHIFKWKFYVNEFDIERYGPIFHKFLKTIRFNP